MLQEPLAILTVLVGVILVSVRLCERYTWAARVSSVVWVLLLAAAVSNLGLIPTDAELYGRLVDFTVPFAVCLILMKVDLGELRGAGKAMSVSFALACLGTILGVLVAGVALDPWLEATVGAERWKLAGPYTGTYIGGSLNFFSLWSGLEMGQPDLFAAANAVDNLTLFPLFAFWMLVPSLLGDRFPVADHWHLGADVAEAAGGEDAAPRFVTGHIVALGFVALLVMVASGWIKTHLLDSLVRGVPTILVITTLALLVGQMPAIKRLEGAWELGHLAFFLFFAAVGAMINLYNAVMLSPILFAYVMIVIVVHMVVIYGLGRLARIDVGVLTIASAAAKAGPPLVLAIAESRGWHRLGLPGVLVGLLGYAIGNYVGFAVAYLMRGLLGA